MVSSTIVRVRLDTLAFILTIVLRFFTRIYTHMYMYNVHPCDTIRLWFNFGCISKGISFPLCIKFNAFEPHCLGIVSREYPLKMDKVLFVLCWLIQCTPFHTTSFVSSLNKRQRFSLLWKCVTVRKIKTISQWVK